MPAAAMAASSRWRRAAARGMLSAIIRIITPRRLRRHVPLRNIVRDRAAVAQARVAPAAAAGGAEDEAVAWLHRHACRLEELLFGAVAAHQNGFVDGARLAAVEPPPRILCALAVDVCWRFSERPVGQLDPKPAPMTGQAAR